MKESLIGYLRETVDAEAGIEPMDVSAKLPMLAVEMFSFRCLHLFGSMHALIQPMRELPETVALAKQVANYEKMLGMPVVLLLKSLSGMRRMRLIEKRIPFILENGQLYLPFVALHLMPTYRRDVPNTERFSNLSQLFFLYFLYHEHESRTVSEMSTWMRASDMSASRGLSELYELGFLTFEMDGKTKKAKKYCRSLNMAYYPRGWKYIGNPVEKTVWIRESDLAKEMHNLPKAGLDALSSRSMLNPPKYPVKSMWIRHSAKLKQYLLSSPEATNDQVVELQLWKYDPVPLSENGMVDVASLAISLAAEKDDRIQAAIHEMLKEMPWYME